MFGIWGSRAADNHGVSCFLLARSGSPRSPARWERASRNQEELNERRATHLGDAADDRYDTQTRLTARSSSGKGLRKRQRDRAEEVACRLELNDNGRVPVISRQVPSYSSLRPTFLGVR